MARRTLTIKIEADGVRETLAAFRHLPKDASAAIRDESKKLAQLVANDAASAARSQGGQAALMASTVKVARDRVPAVQAGGSARVGRKGSPAWALLFGSEFGASGQYGWYGAPRYRGESARQYKPHRGAQGYWFFPTVERDSAKIIEAWNRAATEIINRFEGG